MIWVDSIKNAKTSNKIAALICIAVTLVLSYMLYASEYHYSGDKETITTALNDFLWPYGQEPKFKVIEVKKVDHLLFASFRNLLDGKEYGVAAFLKGFNNRYRIIKATTEPSDYSAVVGVFQLEMNKKDYYAVSGYNLPKEVAYYGLNYYDFYNEEDVPEDQKTRTLRFEVEKPQFLDLYIADELDKKVIGENSGDANKYRIASTALYDLSGKDITATYKLAKESNPYSNSAAKMELFLLYVSIGAIMVFGAVLTRYFLTK